MKMFHVNDINIFTQLKMIILLLSSFKNEAVKKLALLPHTLA